MKKILIGLTATAMCIGVYAFYEHDGQLDASAAIEATANQPDLVVEEVIQGGPYLYIRYLENDADVWIATRSIEVGKGDAIRHADGMEMHNFYSRALDRTFDTIFFVDQLAVVSPETLRTTIATAHNSAGAMAADETDAAPPFAGEIERLEDGETVAGVLAGYPDHRGHAVSLRARVMKVTQGILDRNWVTLQDGTGTAPDNQVIATTLESVAVGDVLVVSGTIANDLDLGFGYKYKVILEEATFK